MRSRKRAESDRINCPRRLSDAGCEALRMAARSAASQREPTFALERNAAAITGLMTDPGIASWNTAGFKSWSGR